MRRHVELWSAILGFGMVVAMVLGGCDDDPPATVQTTCQFPRKLCNDNCVDLARDPSNCGTCGTACNTGEVCQEGVCVLACSHGATECPEGCRDLAVDPHNCGECGNACVPGQICRDGTCRFHCAPGMVECDGACRDVMVDANHCGGCGNACDPGERCRDGACHLTCPSGLTECEDACRDLGTDLNHCGACFNACPEGQICQEGFCVTICPPEMTDCLGTCTALDRDPLNCGVCGNACGPGLVCAEGECRVTCPPGMVRCSGRCTDLSYDPEACGFCGIVCTAPENALPVCLDGVCDTACAPDREDCNEDDEDGCEVVTTSDPLNCGACDHVCEAGEGAHMIAACVDGACVVECEEGYALCPDPDPEGEGDICTNVSSDPLNCGGCGITCAEGETCREGECGVFGPTRDEVQGAVALEDAWLQSNPYSDKHDGGWDYSPLDNVLYAIYGNDSEGQRVYRIDHIGHSAEHVASLSYNRHGSHPVVDGTGRYVYFPPSQNTNQLERLDTTDNTVEILAAAPTSGTFSHCDWKNDRLWCVLNDGWLSSYDPATNAWSPVISYGAGQGMVVAHDSAGSEAIYVWLTNETFWAYDTVTGENRSLAPFPVSADLGGNGQIAYVPSGEGDEYGFIYAVSGCSGSPRMYSIRDNEWFALADAHDNGGCHGHATYDSSARRLYVSDGSDRVWYYQY